MVGASTAASDAEFIFLCVPTPLGEDGAADMSFVEAVAREIAPVLRPGTVVINKSTVPVGSTRFVQRVLSESGAPTDGVSVASNPEFLREGHAVHDFLNPNRIVIGCDDPESAVRVSALYATVEAPMLVTDPASAEMIKYASNAFLATKISFINAIANLCEMVDADVSQVAVGMGYDTRIGSQFLHPGPGYGGSCFPKDTAALLHRARSVGYDFQLLEGVTEVNNAQYERMVDKVRRAAGGSLDGAVVAVLGPHVQGQHRRPPRLARGDDHQPLARGGRDHPRLRPRCRRQGGTDAARLRGVPGPVRRGDRRGRRSSSSRNGTTSGTTTSSGCSTRCGVRPSSTPGTCSTRPRCGGSGSTTRVSAGADQI